MRTVEPSAPSGGTAPHPMAGSTAARRLPAAAKLLLAAEILLSYMQARRALARHELPRVLMIVRRAPRRVRRRPLPDGRRDGGRLGAAVERTLSALPQEVLCLTRLLVLLRLLARRGVEGTLVIAVQPDGTLELRAHAWVEVDGCALLPPAAADWGRLLAL
jgi:hypothetical protein